MKIPSFKVPDVKGALSVAKAFTMAHRPELLFGASVASTLGAVVMAAKGGYESGRKIEQIETHEERIIPVKEKIQLTWLNYLPAAGLTVGAIGSTTGLHIVHVKEKKAIAAAALMAIDEIKNEANDYKEKVQEILSDNGATEEEKSARIEELQPENGWASGDLMPHDPMYMCYDDLANRPVKSTRDLIRRAAEVLISEANKTGKADLNLFYEEIDLTPSQMGSQLGWAKEDLQGYGGKKGMELISFGLTDMPDGSSAVAFWFREPPTSDFEARSAS